MTQKLLKISFLMIQVILEMNEFEGSLFLRHNSCIVKLRKNVLAETRAGQHSELL